MVSVIKETNETILKIVDDLKSKLDESHALVNDIQSKMDAKLEEAKAYKVQVDEAKARIKTLEEEINGLNNDLAELKEKYGKKNLIAVIEAGTKEINAQVKQKQDEIAIHKNKIAELTNRARSIKDLLLNLKKDKKIKEVRLNELEESVHYYGTRLAEVVSYTEEHEDLNDYFQVSSEPTYFADEHTEPSSVFEDIASIDEPAKEEPIEEESKLDFEPVSEEETDEVFNQVINGDDISEEGSSEEESTDTSDDNTFELTQEENDNSAEQAETSEFATPEEEPKEESTHDLEINDLLSVKAPENATKKPNLENLNQAIDEEFSNLFGKNINEPITDRNINANITSEVDVVNSLTTLGLDYYAFKENDRENISNNYNETTVSGIIKVLKDNNIPIDNIYEAPNVLTDIAPAELSNIISKLLNVGQSASAISFVLDKLPNVDINLLNATINNYGDYIKNVDLADIIIKSLKGGI